MTIATPLDKSRPLKPPTLKWASGYLIALKLAVVLLFVLLIILFGLLRQNEEEEQHSTLIADVLWLEQAVNFHLEGNSEKFQQLANDLVSKKSNKTLFELRSQYLLKNNPDLQQILWLDASAKILDLLPAQKLPRLGVEAPGNEGQPRVQERSIEMARKLGKPVYTNAYRVAGTTQFEVYFPVFENRQYRGSIVSVYSLNTLLKQMVPWWFAEKYQVNILDANGVSLASNSKVSNLVTTVNYSIPFDPPGFGTVLQVAAYRSTVNLAQTLITALVVALAIAVLWSLWVMRGHIQRRLVAEQALRSEYAYRKAMEDSLTVGMRARNRDGKVTYVNSAFCQMVGFSEEELINAKAPMPYWAPEEMERAQQIHDAVIEGKASQEGFEIRFMRKDGSRFDALIYEAPLIDADGQHTGWMASIVDVTARKRAEEFARQQQEKLQLTSRLVTMGELASTLAHELNQPLAAITSYNTGCLNKLESGNLTNSELKGALEKLGVQAQRAGRIIRRVHDFVRKSEPKRAPCNLAEVIDDSIGLIEPAAKLLNIHIVREVEAVHVGLLADRVMLEQLLLNLMRNGIEAMSQCPATPESRCLTIKLYQLDEQIQIRVIDGGTGIPPEVQEKLFTPFFSTKSEGMGMGLNICRSIIEFHKGRLWFENNPKGGTIIVISLPGTPL
ncbi:MAG: ATP-binding protein [Betaproteobacteria bacterium]